MPDALRTRIAAALKSYGLVDQYGDPLPDEELFDLADAVIRELKMQKALRPNDYGHCNYPPGDRYITDWIPDD